MAVSRRASLMGFKLLLCLSSPNYPSLFAVLFDIKQLLKVKFVIYYVMTKMGTNEYIHCIIVNKYGALI